MKLLLLSNSRSPDGSYLVHAQEAVRALLKDMPSPRRGVFVPYAGVTVDWDAYTATAAAALEPCGLTLSSVHQADDPSRAIEQADVILVGGGNTFRLLKLCRENGLLGAIARKVRAGTPYIGWSAGSNLTCPSIKTTNDMPIDDPCGFDALGLIPFQINPHYTNALPAGHQGETRNQRLAEYLAANPQAKVLGLPEGDWLVVTGDENSPKVVLEGPKPAFWFTAGNEPQEVPPGPLELCCCCTAK